MTSRELSVDFIRQVFGPGTTEQVYICSLPNDDARDREPGEKRVLTRDLATIERFAAKWDRVDRGMYFCVGTIREGSQPEEAGGSPRNKANVAEVPFLHADTDLKDITVDLDEAQRRVLALPLPPSIIVRSGNGLHSYWLLNEGLSPTEGDDSLSSTLKQLSDLVGGDFKVCHQAALMRLPGTHNTKRGSWAPVEIVFADYARRYEISDIEEMLGYMSPVVPRRALETKGSTAPSNPFLVAADRLGFRPPIDVEQRLSAMSYQGVGDSSIHATQLSVTASLLSRGTDLEEVIDSVLAATRAAAGDYGSRWNWSREERAIRKMCDDWLRKNPAPASEPRSEPMRLTTNGSSALAPVTDLSEERAKREKKKEPKKEPRAKAAGSPSSDKTAVATVVADGVVEAVRQAGQDILLSEGEIFVYAEGVWHVMTPADQQWLMTLIQEGFETLNEPMKVSSLNATWKRLTEHPKLFRRTVPWLDAAQVVCANGVLDIESKEFLPHSAERYARRKIGTAFDPDATCPQFEAFMDSLFKDRGRRDQEDLIALAQEWVGAALATRLLSREERKALILVGPSRTGKTEFSRIVRSLLGEPVATPSVAEISERFGLSSLYEAVAWIRDDAINEGDQLDPQRFKTIVTGEPIDIERKHRDSVRGVELALPVLLTTNALPRARDRSDAIFNRAMILEMTNVVTEEGAHLARQMSGVGRGQTIAKHIFEKEGPGILNWALEGLRRLLDRGAFNPPEIMRTAIQRFKDDNNPVAEFARTGLVRRDTGKVARHDIMCAFHGWQREQDGDDAKAFGARAFFPRLRAAMPWITDMTDNHGRRYFAGLALTDEGLQLWKQHYDGPQLKGGSKGISHTKDEVNKPWKAEQDDELSADAPRF